MKALMHTIDYEFDLAIVDPVYGIKGNSHRRNQSRGRVTKSKKYHSAIWDQQITNDEYFIQLFRVSKNQIVFGGNYFSRIGKPFKTPRRTEYEKFIEQNPTNWIIWDKVNSTTDFNDCELIWTSYPIQTEVFYYMWSGMMQGLSFKQGMIMNPYKHLNQKRIHPTEKPFEVYKYLLNRFYKPGIKILDTHVGSGSLRTICYNMNIRFVGYEIDEKYFNDQEQRFKDHVNKLTLNFMCV